MRVALDQGKAAEKGRAVDGRRHLADAAAGAQLGAVADDDISLGPTLGGCDRPHVLVEGKMPPGGTTTPS